MVIFVFYKFELYYKNIIIIYENKEINEKEYEYEEITINVITGDYNLPGILTLPISNKKVPAVVFVHGSGANDMHETVGKLRLFEDLAKNIQTTVPLSMTQREQILALRAWANVRAVSATKTSSLKQYKKEIDTENVATSRGGRTLDF